MERGGSPVCACTTWSYKISPPLSRHPHRTTHTLNLTRPRRRHRTARRPPSAGPLIQHHLRPRPPSSPQRHPPRHPPRSSSVVRRTVRRAEEHQRRPPRRGAAAPSAASRSSSVVIYEGTTPRVLVIIAAPIVTASPPIPLILSKSVVVSNEHDEKYSSSSNWDFNPVILVPASASFTVATQRMSSEFSWHYNPGAGDDEKSWARGLTRTLFWKHSYDLLDGRPDLCSQLVATAASHPRSSCFAALANGGRAPPETRFSPKSVRVGAFVVLSPRCAAPERATRRSSTPCHCRPASACGFEEKDEEVG